MGDEEERQVRHSGCCDDQDSSEEGDQGWEARGLRQSRHGEGEAGQDRRQGLPREGPQGRVLRASRSIGEPREEAPRVFLRFPPLALLPALTPSSLPPVNPSVILSRPAGGCVVKHWPSGPRTPGERGHMYSTPVLQ